MALGIIPARGPWEYRLSTVTTVSNGGFQKGELVKLDKSRSVSLFSSVASNYYGVAMGSSANSLPAGKQVIAIPAPGCTAYVDTYAAAVSSELSLGQTGSIISVGGITSTLTLLLSQSFSSNMVTVVGPVDTASSRIEVCFIVGTATFYSASSATLNN